MVKTVHEGKLPRTLCRQSMRWRWDHSVVFGVDLQCSLTEVMMLHMDTGNVPLMPVPRLSSFSLSAILLRGFLRERSE